MKAGDNFSRVFVVDEPVYSGFIQTFHDTNPLHTNDEFARSMGFKSKVMHGNILNGFISYFIGECLPQKNVFILTQEISYSNPVYIGDQLNFSATITEVHESVNVTDIKYKFSKTDGTKVAFGKIKIGLR
ncbi:MAG TPA: MaoC/PaaZ C-terminal domain-containing protein [Flavobacteriales bacterium]|nr:MaoC/PaaZ C-terminal domain-containing protein [Flavobacteriales bacterium]